MDPYITELDPSVMNGIICLQLLISQRRRPSSWLSLLVKKKKGKSSKLQFINNQNLVYYHKELSAQVELSDILTIVLAK